MQVYVLCHKDDVKYNFVMIRAVFMFFFHILHRNLLSNSTPAKVWKSLKGKVFNIGPWKWAKSYPKDIFIEWQHHIDECFYRLVTMQTLVSQNYPYPQNQRFRRKIQIVISLLKVYIISRFLHAGICFMPQGWC